MRDFFPLFRHNGPQCLALHCRFEKSGLSLDNQPIPWNADAVVVEALLRLSAPQQCTQADFQLRCGHEITPPESMRADEVENCCRLVFRNAVPAKDTPAELLWRGRSLGHVSLLVLSRAEFRRRISLQNPTLAVRLGTYTVACQTFVSTQCQGLILTGLLSSTHSLVPICDLALQVEVREENGKSLGTVPVQLSSSQLRARQALVTVVPPRPKSVGNWQVTWLLDGDAIACQTIKAISKSQFVRSLGVTSTRFLVQTVGGALSVARFVPEATQIERLGPCFVIQSSEPGVAGLCDLQTRVQVAGAVQPPVIDEARVLITDGPQPYMPGTLHTSELSQIKQFELRCGRRLLATLPLARVPSARFTAEGGYVPAEDFPWSPTADEQFQDKLGKLLEG